MSDKRCAVVTGGSRGIGRAICLRFAEEQMNIVINYAGNEDAANETVKLCEEKGAKCLLYKGDVSNAQVCDGLVAFAKENFGRLDVFVNNAGITRDGLIISMKEEDLDAVLDTNLKGTILCGKAAAKLMLRQKSGRIVNLTSIVGLHGNAGQTNYSASKAGVIGFTKSLAKELASRGITVNAVAPGFVETDMTDVLSDDVKESLKKEIPLTRIGKAEEIAEAVAFLASDKASYITGQVLGVDGGMGM